jgi:nucleoside-diphosphate-sugar epimerase
VTPSPVEPFFEHRDHRHLKVGVAGASGQVGSRLLRHLRESGIAAVAAVRNPLGAALCDAAAPGSTIRIGSLTPPPGEAHVLDDCDVIVNCALASSGGIPRHAYTRNRALVDGLLGAKALKWLVHVSSVAVYGELIAAQPDADRWQRNPRPGSEYGRSKLAIERYAAQQARARGLCCTVLRLGHVYGAGIARSREILEFARNPAFQLPFDGRLPSNAIHVDAAGGAIAALLSGEPVHGVRALAEPLATWRDIFDWHTGAVGLPDVPALSEEASIAQRRIWADAAPGRELVSWVRGLPLKSLVRSPATFDVALRLLVRTPFAITRRVSDMNRRAGARAQIARAEAAGHLTIPPLYLSDGMPGPFLDLAPIPDQGFGSAGQRARELERWFEAWRAPRWPAAAAVAAHEEGHPQASTWA